MLTINLGNQLRTGRWLLLAMLSVLHGALLLGVQSPWAHPLMLAHLGLFLIWQPLWRGEGKVGMRALLFIIAVAWGVLFFLSWWFMAFWLIGLFGLVGGRVLAYRSRWARVYHLTQMVYLLALLLLWVVPNLFAVQDSIDVGRVLLAYVLPVGLPALLLVPRDERGAEISQTIDFFYSLLLFMLLALLVLGCLAFMTVAHLDYLDALLRTLFLIGIVLLALGGLWNPFFGAMGLQIVFSRYLLNIGTPFESWLLRLADAAQHEPDADHYLRAATTLLADLHWLSGVSWQVRNQSGQLGECSAHVLVMDEGELRLSMYVRQPPGQTVLMHLRLLSQLVGYFYQAKQREQSLRDITRMQTVYETGSRLTHDLKNMLQSLLSLTAIAQSSDARSQQLLQQQLPALTQRIERTLIKLQQPKIEPGEGARLPVSVWWESARQRYAHQDFIWHEAEGQTRAEIPAALFDCVLDNFLDNALCKRQTEPGLRIEIRLTGAWQLSVCDNGRAVPAEILPALLHTVVVSQQGMGIGLYQAARWAEQLGYGVYLSSNRDGAVCFALRGTQSVE